MQYCFSSSNKELDNLIEQYRTKHKLLSRSQAIESMIITASRVSNGTSLEQRVSTVQMLMREIEADYRKLQAQLQPTQPPVDFTQQPMQQQNP